MVEWQIDWGDGTIQVLDAIEITNSAGILSHSYPDGPAAPTIELTLTDEDGKHSSGSWTVQVRNADPSITSFSRDTASLEGSPFSFSIQGGDPAGSNDILTYTWDFGDDSQTLSGTDLTHVVHTYRDNGEFALQVTVRDEDGGEYTHYEPITVENAPPTAMDDHAVVAEDGSVTVEVLSNDSDPGGKLDPLTISAVGSSSYGTVSIAADGTTLTYTPHPDFHGSDSFSYTVSDDDGAADVGEVSLTVLNTVDLTGIVFDDQDNDGLFEAEDLPLAGQTMELVREVDLAVVASVITDDAGQYAFDFGELSALEGKYTVRQALPPQGLLDGRETLGDLGGSLSDNGSVFNAVDSNEIRGINIQQPGTQLDTAGYNFAEIKPSSLQCLVWEDFDNDGEVDFGEIAIEGVQVFLTGNDDRGNAVALDQLTDSQGIVEFVMLRPGNYSLREIQPDGYIDGKDVVGEVNGALTGDHDGGQPALSAGNDLFSSVQWVEPGSAGINYNFGERFDGGQATTGQTAGIGFWQNRNGRQLIASLNGSPHSTLLAQYLSETFPNMYAMLGDADGDGTADDPMPNHQVADFYKTLFKRNGRTSPGGPPKLDAQVMGTAIATYVSKASFVEIGYSADGAHTVRRELVNQVEAYGFRVTVGGVGSTSISLGDKGVAFGLENDSQVRIIDLLLATDELSWDGILFDADKDGELDESELIDRVFANDLFQRINER